MLWNRNFSLLVTATVLFHAAVYMLFPSLHQWTMAKWGFTDLQSTYTTVLFGLSLFLLGAFNSYLMDTFSRKRICIWSILLFAVLTLVCPYLTAGWQVVALRIVQGSLCGIALMATGSTLAIDVTPSHRRDGANRAFAHASMIGMLAGFILGKEGGMSYGAEVVFHASAVFCLVAALLVAWVKVCFRAPLDLPLCSSDRFLLPRALPPGINMMTVPMVLGMLVISVSDVRIYLSIGAGFLLCVLLRQAIKFQVSGTLRILAGQLLMMGGLWLLYGEDALFTESLLGGGLVGLGVGISIGHFLQLMILLPRHCERGTSYHTYRLLWETGLVLGILAGRYMLTGGVSPFVYELLLCVTSVSAYVFYTHLYFKNHYQQL